MQTKLCALCASQVLLCKTSISDYLPPSYSGSGSSKQRTRSQIVAVKTLHSHASKQTQYVIFVLHLQLYIATTVS